MFQFFLFFQGHHASDLIYCVCNGWLFRRAGGNCGQWRLDQERRDGWSASVDGTGDGDPREGEATPSCLLRSNLGYKKPCVVIVGFWKEERTILIKVIGRRDARIQHTWNKIIRCWLHVTLEIDPTKKAGMVEVTMGWSQDMRGKDGHQIWLPDSGLARWGGLLFTGKGRVDHGGKVLAGFGLIVNWTFN